MIYPVFRMSTANKLKWMLALEAEHGPLPGTSPALKDVLDYLKMVCS